MPRYQFGAVTVDAEADLPGLDHRRVAAAARGIVQFSVRESRSPFPDGNVVLRGGRIRNFEIRATPSGGWAFEAGGVGGFSVDPDRTTVLFHQRHARLTADDSDFLLTTVIPRTLTTHGYLVVHGAGIVTPGGVVVICGPSGIGKSTLAAACAANRNAVVLGDDSIVLDVRQGSPITAWACDPDVRLWADSARVTPTGGIPLARYGPRLKARHPMPSASATGSAHPLRAVVRLIGSPAATLRPLRPAPAVMAVRDNLLRIDRADPHGRAEELRKLAQLAEQVPMLELGSRRAGYSCDAEMRLLDGLARATA